MQLPNLKDAVVPRRKLTAYLLSPTHRAGRHKAAFFGGHDFSRDEWEELAEALLAHAARHEVARVEDSPYGTRYVIDGIMTMPNGRERNLRTVWFIETGEEAPRFVTAYPLPRRAT